MNQGMVVQVLDDHHRPLRSAQVLMKKTEERSRVTPNGAYFKAITPAGEFYIEVTQLKLDRKLPETQTVLIFVFLKTACLPESRYSLVGVYSN